MVFQCNRSFEQVRDVGTDPRRPANARNIDKPGSRTIALSATNLYSKNHTMTTLAHRPPTHFRKRYIMLSKKL